MSFIRALVFLIFGMIFAASFSKLAFAQPGPGGTGDWRITNGENPYMTLELFQIVPGTVNTTGAATAEISFIARPKENNFNNMVWVILDIDNCNPTNHIYRNFVYREFKPGELFPNPKTGRVTVNFAAGLNKACHYEFWAIQVNPILWMRGFFITAQVKPIPAPGLTVAISPTAVTSGGPFAFNWTSTNATAITTVRSPSACPDAGDLMPVSAGSKSLNAPVVSVDTLCTYTATAVGLGGTASNSATLQVASVPAPSLTFTVSPPSVSVNGAFSLIWTSTNATAISTTVTGLNCPSGGALSPVLSGDKALTAPSTATTCVYEATATGPGGVTSKTVTVTVTSPAVSAPTLAGIVPNNGIVGSVVPVTLTGTNFAAGATINAGTGITVSNVVVVSPTQITATFTIAAAATLGDRNVTVTVGGLTSNPKIFTVNPVGGGGGSLPTSCGLLVCFSYDPKVIILPPPGFTRIIKPFIAEVAP